MLVLASIFTFTPSDVVMWHVNKKLFFFPPLFFMSYVIQFAFAFKLMSEFNGNKISKSCVQMENYLLSCV